ncbi:MAG TPA: ABC-F family ATP-binding cassette domain-containing protein [Acholeplasma sp.]|nr:ABC-F family ATP-binding cassette domain-containing protein [Acholeplasma sp.]
MSILEVKNISFKYGDENLYEDASMRLFDGEHAVLVGPNGTGKTTLLKLLDKQIKPDKGSVEWVNNKRVGYLDQYAKIDNKLTVKTYLYDVFTKLFDMEAQMEKLYESIAFEPEHLHERILNQASSIGESLIEADFYAIKSKIGNVIHGLGLTMDVLNMPIKHLSGGMRAKIILAKLLLEEADILLLDEPTNFLDKVHIEWLGKFLNSYPKAFVVVSHNEDFLRVIAKTVFALEAGKIIRYKGDFEFYLKERTLRYEQQDKAFKAQSKKIKEIQTFINKNITRASTTKRAQSRRKMLEKMVLVNPPQKSKKYKFSFPVKGSTGKDVLVVKDLLIGYNEPLLDPIDLKILKEEKVVITGKNGIGKSTFIKTILNQIPAIDGSFAWIDTAKIAYLEQENIFKKGDTAFSVVSYHYPDFDKKTVMRLLAEYGIDFETANRPIETLSGGEQTKVRLSLLKHQAGNVLILDEPTNHLDVEAKDALKRALMDYQGTLILVSHEKSFFEGLCDYELSLYEEA